MTLGELWQKVSQLQLSSGHCQSLVTVALYDTLTKNAIDYETSYVLLSKHCKTTLPRKPRRWRR